MLKMATIRMKISSYMDRFVAQFRGGTGPVFTIRTPKNGEYINCRFYSESYGWSEAVEVAIKF
jgi:hypothetical protein